jgi:hypothetical protein
MSLPKVSLFEGHIRGIRLNYILQTVDGAVNLSHDVSLSFELRPLFPETSVCVVF